LRFFFNESAGCKTLILKGESFKHIIRACRHRVSDSVYLRSLADTTSLFTYVVTHVDGRKATLSLQNSQKLKIEPKRSLHIGWAIVDPKSIEKVLGSLCEFGVSKITFIKSDRSQNSFKIDLKRLERIVLNSMQQCGRTDMMIFEETGSIDQFLQQYPNSAVLDLSSTTLEDTSAIEVVIVGCEGGFSERERELFLEQKVFSFSTKMILRAESAVLAISSKILI